MSIVLTDMQNQAVDSIVKWYKDKDASINFILAGLAGSGKAQPLDSLIMTPKGYVKMGDIKLGDEIFGEDGKVHHVIGIFPQGKKDVYEIEFSDKTKVQSCKDHLWNVQSAWERDLKKPFSTVSLETIINDRLFVKTGEYKRWNVYIPMCSPIEFPTQKLEIPPYIMGVLLGDATFRNTTISLTNPEVDIIQQVKTYCDANGFNLRLIGETKISYSISDLQKTNGSNRFTNFIKKYNLYNLLSHEKFIPKLYLLSDIHQRIELLSGLIDTDGEVNNSEYVFTSTSKQLIDDVEFLVESLGGTATCSVRQTHYTHNDEKRKGKISYRLTIKMPINIQIFKSEKHKKKFKVGQTKARRTMRKITYIGEKECQCIMTNNPSGLYLTNNCIVTHNTSVIPFIIEALNLPIYRIKFAAFTGKAAMVMRKKGLPASTIHSLIYKPKEYTDNDGKRGVIFELVKHIDGDPKLIIIDEASMVSKKLKEDLESFDIPILYVGDHGQLPPVSSDQINMMEYPDFVLTEIHRQALENPIIWIAHEVRQGKRIQCGKYGNTVIKIPESKVSDIMMLNSSQIICGLNKTRKDINHHFRMLKGFDGLFPVENDKLTCLKNNHDLGLFNGMIGTCHSIDHKKQILTFEDDDNELFYDLKYDIDVFHGEKPKYNKKIEQFDYGYAITAHRSQGSQFQNVLLYEEMQFLGGEFFSKWLYTGITRAEEKIIIVE